MRIGLMHGGALGDVVATLPMAGAIKAACPGVAIVFIGRRYVEPLALASRHIDSFLDADAATADAQKLAAARLDILLNPFPFKEFAEIAARARVPLRIGNLRRPKIARWCNRFVFYGRAGSGLHEAALNMRDLRALGLRLKPSIAELAALAGVTRLQPLAAEHRALLAPGKFHLLFHVKSGGNGREWPLEHFRELAAMLPADRVQIVLTGSAAEGTAARAACPALPTGANVTDAFGRFELPQLMAFIAAADGMVAASTGPLHLAAVLGIHALGIYPGRAGFNAQRWFPLGPKGEALQTVAACAGDTACLSHPGGPCSCTVAVTPQMVYERVMTWLGASGRGIA
jgi:lipopolysaccharide heptosyltransferase III